MRQVQSGGSNLKYWLAVLVLTFASAAAEPAHAQVTITGTTQQITSSFFNQIGPSISGNFICYTDYTKGINEPQVHCDDWTAHTDYPLTTASPLVDQTVGGVSGSTVVYTEFKGGLPAVWACPIPSGCPTGAKSLGSGLNPSIDGTLVAWFDNSSGNYQIMATDLNVPGAVKQLTNNSGNNNSLAPNVSGRTVVYSLGTDSSYAHCQIHVTNFDTLSTRQITASPNGCNSSPDISGNYVVYQADRVNTPPINQNIYVYDLAANTETQISLPNFQQNPHVSGDWVSFDDVANGISSILLYHIPSGTVLTAVQATTNLQSAFLNDIDGTNVAYTSDASGSDNIYLFRFTVMGLEVPFDTFHVRAEADLSRHHARDSFTAEAEFHLGKGSAGINPSSDSLHFKAAGGTTNLVFDAALSQFHAGHNGRLNFNGMLNGFPVEIHLRPLHHSGAYEFSLEARKLNLAQFSNPLAITLQVGSNIGQITINAEFDRHHDEDH